MESKFIEDFAASLESAEICGWYKNANSKEYTRQYSSFNDFNSIKHVVSWRGNSEVKALVLQVLYNYFWVFRPPPLCVINCNNLEATPSF